MASPQPLACTSLHLPPDVQPFLRIHEISLHVFLPNLDRLRLSLEAGRDINLEATKIFAEMRKALREQLRNVFKVPHIAQVVAQRYFKLLEALSERKPTRRPLYKVHLGTCAGRVCSEEAEKAMNVFREELENAIRQVTAILNTTSNYKKGSKPSLTSTENTKSVSEIFCAIDECKESLQQCYDQFAKLATQTQDQTSVDSNPPFEEEIQVMRAKWQTFFDNIRGVWMHGFDIADEILLPSLNNRRNALEWHEPRKDVFLWRALFQRLDKRDFVRSTNVMRPSIDPEAAFITGPDCNSQKLRTNVIKAVSLMDPQMASGITDIPGTTLSNGSASKISFWQRILMRQMQ